jgi:hypothetical protein
LLIDYNVCIITPTTIQSVPMVICSALQDIQLQLISNPLFY